MHKLVLGSLVLVTGALGLSAIELQGGYLDREMAPTLRASSHSIVLRISGVKGNSTLPGYQGWIDVESYGFDVDVPVVIGGGTGGTSVSKPEFGPLTVVTGFVPALPQLLLTAAKGNTITQIDLEVVVPDTSGKLANVFSLRLDNAWLTRIDNDSDGGDEPTNAISFEWEKATWTTHDQGSQTSNWWDRKANTGN